MNFKSNFFYDTVYDIEYKLLKSKGIKALIFDIDNTLAEYDEPYPSDKLLDLFEKLKSDGFGLYLLSNNNRLRVKLFSEAANLPYRGRALKPLKVNIKRAMKILSADKESTALIGDQLFTDVWGANRAGVTSILVNPISDKEDKFVAFKRNIEKLITKNN